MKQEGIKRVAVIAILLLVIFTSFGKMSKQLGNFIEAQMNLALTSEGVVPSMPTYLKATTGMCGGQISISWEAASGAMSYEIYSVPGGKRPPVTGTSFIDTNLVLGGSYAYQIRALNGSFASAWTLPPVSASASVACSPTETPPPPPPAPTVTISASPATIISGGSSTLLWSSANATGCNASGSWSGAKGTYGSESVSPGSTSVYTISCTGSGGSTSQTATISVNPPPPPPPPPSKFKIGDSVKTTSKLNIRSTPAGSRLGQQSLGATGVVVGGPVLGKESQVWWNVDYVNSPDGWAVETYLQIATSTPPPPPPPAPTVTISASPASIMVGDSSDVTWSATNATSCTASGGWSGTKAISGTESVTPSANATYTLTCSGAGGSANAAAAITVTALPVSTKFKAGDSVQTNSSLNVRSTANGALLGTQLSSSLGTVVGGPTYAGGFHWWNIDYVATPDGWSVEDFLDKYVAPPATPTLTFSASPSTVTSGQTSTLTWSATNATSCTASGGWSGAKATASSEIVTPTVNTTYTLTCVGVGGTVIKNAQVYIATTGTPTAALPKSVPSIPASLYTAACTSNPTTASALQTAVSSAKGGDVICLSPGVTYGFTGALNIPARSTTDTTGWTVIRTNPSVSLTQGKRITPSTATNLAKVMIKESRPGTIEQAIRVNNNADRWLFLGLEVLVDPATNGGPANLIDVGPSPAAKVVTDLPTDIAFVQVYAHGNPTQNITRAFALNGGAQTVKDSWCSEIHRKNTDSQCTISWAGSGPFLIENNHLESGSENIMWGGADPGVVGLRPSDATVRGNYIYKPISWKGQGWLVKNLVESKNVERLLIENNVLDGAWTEGQQGQAWVFKSVNQNNICPWCGSFDITVRRNLIKNVGSGLHISGSPEPHPAPDLDRLTFEENWFEPINTTSTYNGQGLGVLLNAQARNVVMRNNVWEKLGGSNAFGFMLDTYSTTACNQSVPAVTNLFVDNNILPMGVIGLTRCGGPSGAGALTSPALAGSLSFTGNVYIGSQQPNYPAGTQFVTDLNAALNTGKGITKSQINAWTSGVVVAP